MKLKDYLKDQIIPIILYILMLLFILWILLVFSLPAFVSIIILFLLISTAFLIFAYNYWKRKSFFTQLFNDIEELDQKYLIHELIREPDYYEGQLLYALIAQIDKATLDYLNAYKFMINDFKEYLELWIHEIKISLASAFLIVENNKDKISTNMIEELNRIEKLVEQVLFYVRSENVEKDYAIKQCNLEQIVKDVIKGNRRTFINKKIALHIDCLDIIVMSDSKWLTFILNQILDNALKYSKNTDAYIHIFAKRNKDSVSLHIEDNGIGISQNDINRVFDKGFTGENGRKTYNSTGLGLYLCKNLCEKLHHKITIDSTLHQKTIITIVFPIGTYTAISKRNLTTM
ncbi:MAG: HAMP domain-containing histidine kinase [Erysipelotrichia bacterium]|nr:HAMP domain-containing histidine kinase [Erysipelotrichia bacterium]NCC55120.1 HAMP domain-containing histidine kinase [Erysipelotrichia bacterium]